MHLNDCASVTAGVKKLPILPRNRSTRTTGAPPTSPIQLTTSHPQGSTLVSYEGATFEEEDFFIITRGRGQVRGRSRTHRPSGSTGVPARNIYGQQPRNSSGESGQQHGTLEIAKLTKDISAINTHNKRPPDSCEYIMTDNEDYNTSLN